MDGHGDLPTLDPVEQRVVGSLLEKELTVPASYPMTLNALRTACNQSTSRTPVVDYDDSTVLEALDRLKARGLARMVYASSGARSVKYRQVLDEALHLEPDERALVTVLLLRGPQAPGELRSRAERTFAFDDRAAVEACLARLAARSRPLVRELERQPGHQDARWIHLLGPVDVAPAGPGAGDVDRDVVIAGGASVRDAKVVAAYDALASTYAEQLIDELDRKPFDRWLLERLAALADGAPIADVGCGPGHVAFHLAAAGAEVTGFDLSPAMVREACHRFPELAVEVADLTDLPHPASGDGWGAIVAWYSLVHLAGSELHPAVGLLVDKLRPGGWLAIAVHVGDEVQHHSELMGTPVDLHVVFHDADEVVEAFHRAGLVDVEWYRRGPVHEAEVETERIYVIGRRP